MFLTLDQQIKSVINSVDEAILMIDRDLKVVMCNKQFENFFGLPVSTIIHQDKRKAITEQIKWRVRYPDEFERKLFWLYDRMEVVSNDEVEVVMPRRRMLKRFSGPVYDDDHNLIGRVEVYSDITNEIELTNELKEKNEQLFILNAAASSISQSFNLKNFCETFLRRLAQATQAELGLLYVNTERDDFELISQLGHRLKDMNVPQTVNVNLKNRICWGHHSEIKNLLFLKEVLKSGYFLAFQSYNNQGHPSGLCILAWENHEEMIINKTLFENVSVQLGIGISNALLYNEAMRGAILQERDRIAMEMHDGLAQTLGYIGLGLDSANNRINNGSYDECSILLKELREVVDNSYHDVREAIIGLRVDISRESNLLDSIKQYIKEFKKLSDVPVSINISGVLPYIQLEKQLHILRIVQETLTNVRRHAEASFVEITIEYDNNDILIAISDNGQGFDKDEINPDSLIHQGLRIMNKRALALGGKLEIQTEVGHGTTTKLIVPVRK